jgi:hypothetical protein
MAAHKRARALSREILAFLDEPWEEAVADYCRQLHEDLKNGEDPVTVKRKFNAIRRISATSTRQRKER